MTDSIMKPYIICHMMTSLDGKIAINNSREGLQIEQVIPGFEVYYEIEEKLGGEAWMCGRSTFEKMPDVNFVSEELPTQIDSDLPEIYNPYDNYKGEYAIAVDTQGKLRWTNNMVHNKYALIYVVTEQTPKEFLQYLKNQEISYITAGKDKVDFKFLFDQLGEKFRIKQVRLEGGGKLNGTVYDEGLIDEISLVLSPLVINDPSAPTIFENINTDLSKLATRYKLTHLEKLDNDLVWLRYMIK